MSKLKKFTLWTIFLFSMYVFAILIFWAIVNSWLSNASSHVIENKVTVNNEVSNEQLVKEANIPTQQVSVVSTNTTTLNSTWVVVNTWRTVSADEVINSRYRYVIYHLSQDGFVDEKMIDYLEKNPKDIWNVMLSYDSFNQTNSYDDYIKYDNEYLDKIRTENGNSLYWFIQETTDWYTQEKLRNTKIFPFISDELLKTKEFMFIFNGIKNHKGVKNNLQEIVDWIGLDKEYVLACILTEQTRYSITERGFMKQFLWNVPFLFSYTYGSKWVGGIKEFTATKIENDAIKNWYGQIFVTRWNNLNDPYWEVVYPAYLIKNILVRWDNAWYPIDHNPWIVATLYNFGNPDNKSPNADPKIWGSDIDRWTFGELWRNFYYYFKIYWF